MRSWHELDLCTRTPGDVMGAARTALDGLVAALSPAVAPARVRVPGQPAPDAAADEVRVVPMSLHRVGRSRRAGSLLDLELRVLVEAVGPDALDRIEQVLLTLEPLAGYAVEPAQPASIDEVGEPALSLRLVVCLPVTLTLPEPEVPLVTQPPVVEVRPGYVHVPVSPRDTTPPAKGATP